MGPDRGKSPRYGCPQCGGSNPVWPGQNFHYIVSKRQSCGPAANSAQASNSGRTFATFPPPNGPMGMPVQTVAPGVRGLDHPT
eukprot:SAG22_NODE_21541_length_256_cov_0.662420_1_plen_82_part_10